jgi:tetratricopeptide (TPR) repeat protein
VAGLPVVHVKTGMVRVAVVSWLLGGDARGSRPGARSGWIVLLAAGVLVLGACDNDNGNGKDNGGSEDVSDAAFILDQALADHVAGQLEDARAKYNEVLGLEPENRFALYNLGLISHTQGDLQAAEDYYNRTLAVAPDFEAAVFNLAIVRAQLGGVEEAIALYLRTLEINPDNAGAHLNLGFLYLEEGRNKKGNQEIQKAIELDPSLAERVAPPESPEGNPTTDPEE